jgi:hypothetical protein
MGKLIFLAIVGYIALQVYKNAQVDQHYTRTDGWEQTARTRRTDFPPPAVPDPSPASATMGGRQPQARPEDN